MQNQGVDPKTLTFSQAQGLEPLPSRLDTADPVTILPAATAQEGEAITEAMQGLRADGQTAAAGHLKRAGELLGDGEWGESVHESISAIEAVARNLWSEKKNISAIIATLKNDKQWNLHPSFGDALKKLYGWASDEPGVRHGGGRDSGRVGEPEAVFMIPVCAALCTYLLRKQRGQRDAHNARR